MVFGRMGGVMVKRGICEPQLCLVDQRSLEFRENKRQVYSKEEPLSCLVVRLTYVSHLLCE